MAYFPWSEDYAVGIRVIDNDHKALVEIVNDLHDAIQSGAEHFVVGTTISSLGRYVDDHFRREEHYLEDVDYPELADHARAHRRLRRAVYAVRKIHTAEPERLDPQKLLGFLRHWLIEHICGEDMKYVPFLVGKARNTHAHEPGSVDVLPDRPIVDAKADILETVTVKVPHRKVELLKRCAQLIGEGGPEARALEEIADPVTGISLREAERLVAKLLR